MGNIAQRSDSSDFPYTPKEEVCVLSSGWRIKNGFRTADKKPVSIFTYTLPSPDATPPPQVANFFLRFKKFRFPSLLLCLDSVEVGAELFVVTERVRPLNQIIDEMRKSKKQSISWGIYSIIKAVEFLNENKMIHGNLTLESIYVDRQGDWKLCGFEHLTDYPQLTDSNSNGLLLQSIRQNMIPKQFLPPELLEAPQNLKTILPHSIDAWMTACLIYSIFSDSPFTDRQQLKRVDVIPQSLKDFYISLMTSQPTRRATPSSLLSSTFFQNSLVDTCLFLEEINVKEAYELDRFFSKMMKAIDEFPEDITKYKFLPQLVAALDFQTVGCIVLGPILKIGKRLNEEEFNQFISPSLIKWFKSPDKLLRTNLLINISTYVEMLPTNILCEGIYPTIANGYLDVQDHDYRTLCVKATLSFCHKLNSNIIHGILLKSLGKLQVDPVPMIRLYSTQMVAIIADLLKQETREKVLVAAFTRALRDPQPASRIAGLEGFIKTIKYYTVRDCATLIIPALSYICVDGDSKVRETSFSALQTFVKILGEGQKTIVDQVKDGNQQNSEQSGMLGWAVGALATKFYGDGQQQPQPQQQQSQQQQPQQQDSKKYTSSTSSSISSVSSKNSISSSSATQNFQQNQQKSPLKSSQGISSNNNSNFPPKAVETAVVQKLDNDDDFQFDDDSDDFKSNSGFGNSGNFGTQDNNSFGNYNNQRTGDDDGSDDFDSYYNNITLQKSQQNQSKQQPKQQQQHQQQPPKQQQHQKVINAGNLNSSGTRSDDESYDFESSYNNPSPIQQQKPQQKQPISQTKPTTQQKSPINTTQPKTSTMNNKPTLNKPTTTTTTTKKASIVIKPMKKEDFDSFDEWGS